jgi:hypothetical protein
MREEPSPMEMVKYCPFFFAVAPPKSLALAVSAVIVDVEATCGTLNGDHYHFYSQWLHMLIIFEFILALLI